jgi:DNA polymerase-3 subunit delta'
MLVPATSEPTVASTPRKSPRRTAAREEAPAAKASPLRELLGQDRAKADLTSLLLAGRLPPALIFHGPSGVGKMTCAQIVASLLLDPEATEDSIRRFAPPQGTTISRLLEAGSHPDLHLIAKHRCRDSQVPELRERKMVNIPVDLLRELMIGGMAGDQRFEPAVLRTPYLGHGKVFLIDEAEGLDATGQNALLKTLEEPPPRTWIVLCVTDRTRLLPTIRSRCHQVPFSPLGEAPMRRWLADLPPSIPDAEREWLLGFSEGSPGVAALAIEAGLRRWEESLGGPLAALAEDGRIGGFAATMADLVKEFAEAQVKADPRASKEAANRLGAQLLLGILARSLRHRLHAAVAAGDADAAERWADWIERLDLAERHLEANVNLLHALADLVAAWAERSPAAR